jgi:phage-related protein
MEEQPAVKTLKWMGSSKRDVRSFPDLARNRAGFNLGLVQKGREPRNWKPMESIGPGAAEIRVRTNEGGTREHRVIYVAKFAEAVYVLHAFEKKSQKTSPHDVDLAKARYSEMMRLRANSAPRK